MIVSKVVLFLLFLSSLHFSFLFFFSFFFGTGIGGIDTSSAVSLAPHFLVWVVSEEAKFLKGRFVCANWDVDELKGKAKEIASSRLLEANVIGWPFGSAVDGVLAQGGSM